MRRLWEWLTSWAETLRAAPPFSRRRRELLEAIADPELVTAPSPAVAKLIEAWGPGMSPEERRAERDARIEAVTRDLAAFPPRPWTDEQLLRRRALKAELFHLIYGGP